MVLKVAEVGIGLGLEVLRSPSIYANSFEVFSRSSGNFTITSTKYLNNWFVVQNFSIAKYSDFISKLFV